MKKTLSIILTILMIATCIPIFASAAEPVTLTRDNITQWPTVTNKDGSEPKVQAYAGQKYDDIWALKGGKVCYDANGNGELEDSEIVPGTFTFAEERILDSNSFIRINFTPEDETAYTSISEVTNSDAMGDVDEIITVTPEIIEFPVASDVEANARLRTSTLTGGIAKHPITGEVITYGEWAWASSGKKVTASGYYDVEFFVSSGFEIIAKPIYVRIVGDTSEAKLSATIEEVPEIVTILSPDMDWSSVELKGGKAVDSINGATVPGKFTINRTGKISAGTVKVSILFTPDSDLYASVTTEFYVTVEATTVKFIDDTGNEIIPEIEVGYQNEKMYSMDDTISRLLAPYANCGEKNFHGNFLDENGNRMDFCDDSLEIGTTKEYTIHAHSYNSSFASAILKFKMTVVPNKMTATVKYTGNAISVTTNTDTSRLYGTFEYYVNGEKAGTSVMAEYKNTTSLQWRPEKSGVYDITVKYVTGEGDKYYFDDVELQDVDVNLSWNLAVENGLIKLTNSYIESGTYNYGDEVTAVAKNNAAFSHWEVTDKDGNEITIDGFDTKATSNTFKMPDMDIELKAAEIEQRKVTAINAVIKSSAGTAEYYPGQTVTIALDSNAISADIFQGFVITDAQGNAYLPEGLAEEDLMNTSISFIMPDFDITVKATSTADDCDHLCHSENSLLQMLWKLISFFCQLFDIQQYCDCGITHYDAPLF